MSDIKDFVHIGNYSAVAGGVTFHGADNHPWIGNNKLVANYPFNERYNFGYPKSSGKGDVFVGNDVWIGECARILSGVSIGDGAVIGAGAIVTKSVPPFAVVVGNPSYITKYRYTKRIREKLLQIKWWNWNVEIIKERIEDFMDVKKFIKKYEKT